MRLSQLCAGRLTQTSTAGASTNTVSAAKAAALPGAHIATLT
ncbi:MAG: hypothetical protein PHI16_06095 [Methanocellales archaeon]|nr:hypothetical protein [Methanocellales archaeon]